MQFPPALQDLFSDTETKVVKDQFVTLLRELETTGKRPQHIASALSQVLIGYCATKSELPDQWYWAHDCLYKTGLALETKALQVRRTRVRKFLRKTGRLFRESSLECDIVHSPETYAYSRSLRETNADVE